MQLIDGRAVYSATDLVGFLACGHLTNLDRAVVAGLARRPVRDDPELDLIAKRGMAHERRYLADLEAEGSSVTAVTWDASASDQGAVLRQAADATRDAIRSGVDVVYQATFFDGRWRGHADFLRRVHEPSDLGPWSYEVVDTKLARTAKAGAVLQLCVYSALLERVQGTLPVFMTVALGGSARQVERFRTADHMAYFRSVRARFEAQVDSGPAVYPVTATYPEPVEHCDVCRWDPECGPRRRSDDHLSLVAGISRSQRHGLVDRGVATVAALATVELPMRPRLDAIADAAMERIRDQARLQVETREQHRIAFELLEPVEAGRGLALLPPPSPGDLFLDLEGDPFVEDGGADGLEYLFGIIEPGDGLGLVPAFHAFWATDRAAEKVAFERTIDLIMARLAARPDLHVYHYGAYEPGAMKRLMGRHATREDQVDRLLRAGTFVDLLSVVRQGVQAGVESYSIKRLEPLYDFVRAVPLRDAGSSILNFELWLDGGRVEQGLLDLIEAYNRDDCLSNWRLREWLEARRAALIASATDVPRPGERPGDPSPDLSERQAEVEALVGRLAGDLPPADLRTPEQSATWLLAQLLDWHRREAKAFWWRYYAMLEMTPDELLESDEPIGGLEYQGVDRQEKRSHVHRYRFPPQENDIRVGTTVQDPATGKSPGNVVMVDQVEGILELKRSVASEAPHPAAVIPHDHYPTNDQRDALLRLGHWVADHGIEASGPYRAARDLLLRRAPRVGQVDGASLVAAGESELDAARRLVLALDASVLAIQGPPGSGKTTTGARMIVELVRAGRAVGITANSHKVIGNLLDAIAKASDEAGFPIRMGQKPSRGEDPTCARATCYREDADLAGAVRAREIDVAGATAWTWSDQRLVDSLDVLVVDEAGQVALANVIAIAAAARSLVLLGDPQQLEQPLQGSHPPGAEASALQHLLGSHRTMPAGLGLFLERTWRLHPDITRYTSEMFYEDRLESEGHLGVQCVEGDDELAGAGLRWIAVSHEGNVNESAEEAETVARLCQRLMGRGWVDQDGRRAPIGWEDILIVAPFNAQVAAIAERTGQRDRVGTVDKFQGREAAVSIYSMATSSPDLAPRGMEFLYSLNRLNVATSRARCLAIIVGSPELLAAACKTPNQMRLANALCRAVEVARE